MKLLSKKGVMAKHVFIAINKSELKEVKGGNIATHYEQLPFAE